MTNGGNRGNQYTKVAEVQNGPLPKADDTAQKVADDIGAGRSTVKRAEKFFKGVDAAEKITQDTQKQKTAPGVAAPRTVIRGSKLTKPTALQS